MSASEKDASAPGGVAPPVDGARGAGSPATVTGLVASSGVGRRLSAQAAIRRDLDLRASLRLAPTAPTSAADRRRAAEKLWKTAAALREAGQLSESVRPLQQAVAVEPDNANLLFDLGLTLTRCVRHAEAVAPLRRATELKPDFSKAHYLLAEAYEAEGRSAEAMAALRNAIKASPNFTEAHRMLGVLLHRAERLDEARESFSRAAASGRNTAVGRICEAHVLSEDGQFAQAATVLRQALAREPTNGMARMTLGHVLANMGEVDAAVAEFRHVSNLPGVLPVGSWAALIQMMKVTSVDRPLVADIEAFLQRQPLIPRDRMTLHFTLGKAYDDLQDYARAIQHFDAGNSIRNQLRPFDRESLRSEIDAIIDRYDRGFFEEHGGDGLDDDTPVLVLGMPRSGTTLIEQILSSHRDIAGAGELTFWRVNAMPLLKSPSTAPDAATARRLGESYVSKLRGFSATAERIVDKALFNFYWIGPILQALPRARIVHCRRHPVDTCLSIYFTPFETITDFVADRDDLVFYYREYLRLMEHWRAVLPPERFIEVDYEAVVEDPERSARRLIEFCGLPWDPACLRPEGNLRGVRTASVWQVRQPIYRRSLERWRRYEPWLGSLRELLMDDQL